MLWRGWETLQPFSPQVAGLQCCFVVKHRVLGCRRQKTWVHSFVSLLYIPCSVCVSARAGFVCFLHLIHFPSMQMHLFASLQAVQASAHCAVCALRAGSRSPPAVPPVFSQVLLMQSSVESKLQEKVIISSFKKSTKNKKREAFVVLWS